MKNDVGIKIGHQYSMTHTQLHGLYGQTEAMTRQNHKYSHKVLNISQMVRNHKHYFYDTKTTNCGTH